MSENIFDKSDKELDELLKKISDSAEIPFSEKDWSDMNSRLDQNFPTGGLGWKTSLLSWFSSLVFVMAIFVSIWNRQNHVQMVESGVNKEKNENLTLETKAQEISPEPLSESEEPNEIFQYGDLIETNTTNSVTSAYSGNVSILIDNASKEKKSFNFPVSGFEKDRLFPNLNFTSLEKSQKDSFSTKTTNETNPKTTQQNDKKEKGKFGGKFNVSVQVAPDISAIEIYQMSKAGNMLGIGAEYFLLPKFSLSSGIYYSYKLYSGDSGYHINYNYEPSYVIGVCDVLDIPINLRYYPFEGKVQRFFISVGASSYLMLKENYELEYINKDTGYPYTRDIEIKGANQHFLGIANMSLGYERKLGRQISLQVEPYFKVPFSGVGEWDVSLKSTGIFVGLKFYPGQALK